MEVEGKTVWLIEVYSGSQIPCILSGAKYIRKGPNIQKPTTIGQMWDFSQQSDPIYFDEAPSYDFDTSKS